MVTLANTAIIYNGNQRSRRIRYTFTDSLVDSILALSYGNILLIANLYGVRAVQATRVTSISYVLFIEKGGTAPSVLRLTTRGRVVLVRASRSVCRAINRLCYGNLPPVCWTGKNRSVRFEFRLRKNGFSGTNCTSDRVGGILGRLSISPHVVGQIIITLCRTRIGIITRT